MIRKINELRRRVYELESKVALLESRTQRLTNDFDHTEDKWNRLLQKSGHRVRKIVDERVDKRLSGGMYEILKGMIDVTKKERK